MCTTHHTELVVIYRRSVKRYSYAPKYAKITPLTLKNVCDIAHFKQGFLLIHYSTFFNFPRQDEIPQSKFSKSGWNYTKKWTSPQIFGYRILVFNIFLPHRDKVVTLYDQFRQT